MKIDCADDDVRVGFAAAQRREGIPAEHTKRLVNFALGLRQRPIVHEHWEPLCGRELACRAHPGSPRSFAGALRGRRGAAGGLGLQLLADNGDNRWRFATRDSCVGLELTLRRLEEREFEVLTYAKVPANDGGVALGQATIAAAHLIDAERARRKGGKSCALEFPDRS